MTTASPVTEREQALGLPLLQRLQDLALVLEAPEGGYSKGSMKE
jgi:hypothetical protein